MYITAKMLFPVGGRYRGVPLYMYIQCRPTCMYAVIIGYKEANELKIEIED